MGEVVLVERSRNGRALCKRWSVFGKCGCVSIRSVSESGSGEKSNESNGGDKRKKRTKVLCVR